MNKKTFDVIAKYISKETGVKVVISPDVNGPQMNIDQKTIWLPENIKEENALSALASLIHEAGHMKWTVEIPIDKVTDNKTEFHVLNAMEDVRIDYKNFQILPNIREFYKKMYKEHSFKPERIKKLKEAPMLTRVLIANILYQERFSNMNRDPEALDLSHKLGITRLFSNGIEYIDRKMWDELKKTIKEIIKAFQLKDQPEKKQGEGNGKAQGAGKGECGVTAKGEGNEQQNEQGTTKLPLPEIESTDKYIKSGSMWGKGSGLEGEAGGTGFNPIELQETTRKKFSQALSVKERRIVNDGKSLDTDNLIAYFTGEIEALFKDEVVEKKKKSKIIFALDCSGSMGDRLPLDKQYGARKRVLLNTMASLVSFLDEIIMIEGIAVDYDICAFDDRFHKLPKENWRKEYEMHYGGGTNIWKAFDLSRKLLLENPELDGNKMIILATDGAVRPQEVDKIRNDIIMSNTDVRVMIVGIGADLSGNFVKDIIGDNNILCQEHAEQVLMEAIQTMLN